MNIKIERIKRNLKQTELSELTGISQTKISRLERGTLSLYELSYREVEQLSQAFGIDIKELTKEEMI